MCSSNGQFHYVNPSTQLALYSSCIGNCSSIEYIQWNIYQGSMNSTQWTLFSPEFDFGLTTKNLTILKDFFLKNNQSIYWRFELIYLFDSKIYKKQFDIEINRSPRNGYCTFDYFNGSTMDLFQLNCSKWFDEDEIKDYTVYIKNSSNKMILSHSIDSIISLRFPASIHEISIYQIVVHILDRLDCVTEEYLPLITIHRNLSSILHFIPKSNDTIMQLLMSDDRNTIGQIIISICQLLNEMNDQSMKLATESKKDFPFLHYNERMTF